MLAYGQITDAIERSGLAARGAFVLDETDRGAGLNGVSAIVLVGAAGARGFGAFADSLEALDRAADPLDRWSRRVVGALASALGARALYPFGDPPHWPFQRWARRAEALHVSPLGMLIHSDYGLWHSYRGALAFTEPIAVPALAPQASPCDSCASRPCLSACPAGAFAAQGYGVAACAAHLRKEEGLACTDAGCLARRACPVGADYAHGPAQAAFHMRAFLRAQRVDERRG